MHYETTSEKIPITPVAPLQTARPATSEDFKKNRDINKNRTIVLVLLAIQFVFAIFYLIEGIVDLVKYKRIPPAKRSGATTSSHVGTIVFGCITLVYVLLFAFVVFKYIRIPILVFAWLGIVQLILVGIVVVLAIIGAVFVSAVASSVGVGIVISIIIIAVAGLTCILTILTVIFSFKLAKLIKMQEAYQFV